MINLEARDFPHPEDVRAGLFEAFENMIARMQNTLILIENMELMDETSFELFQDLLLKFDRFNVSYVIMSNKDYSLHKSAHFLLSKQEYTEITIKPTPIKAIIDATMQKFILGKRKEKSSLFHQIILLKFFQKRKWINISSIKTISAGESL